MPEEKNGVYFRKWGVKKPKAVIIAVHGMGAHTDRWKFLAEFMNTKKIAVYAVELKGYGVLAQEPGYAESFRVYYRDIAALKAMAISENPNAPVFIIGESMGGLITHMNLIEYDGNYSGVIEVSPAFMDNMKMSLGYRLNIFLNSIINPKRPFAMPFKSEELTHDKAVLKWLAKEKKEHRFAAAGPLKEILFKQIKAGFATGSIRIPALFLIADQDYLINTKSMENIFGKVKSEKRLIKYENTFHALSIEKDRNKIFEDIHKWMTETIKKGGGIQNTKWKK